jgi:hypothetical protein
MIRIAPVSSPDDAIMVSAPSTSITYSMADEPIFSAAQLERLGANFRSMTVAMSGVGDAARRAARTFGTL